MRLIAIPLILSLAACSMTPMLVKPDLPVPSAFPQSDAASQAQTAARLGWRTMFMDPRLQQVIDIALANNRDLKLAALNADTVQSQYRVTRAAQLPAVAATVSASRQRGAANGSSEQATSAAVQNQVGVNVGFSAFELDLFGRARASTNAAFERYLSSEEGRRAAQITLIGAVADAYVAERVAGEQLKLAEQTLSDWQQSLLLTQQLRQAAQSNSLELAQAEGQVASALADLEVRKRNLARASNALALLVGGALPKHLAPAMEIDDQLVQTKLPAGIPSDLLASRPDILQAEHNLIAANADIGVAKAAFFPQLSLTSTVGFASTSLNGLFRGDQRSWSFAPQISLPIFNAGRLRGELQLAELRKSAAVVEYERTIQTAFREVADGLAGQETYGRQMEAQQLVVSRAQHRAALAEQRYRAGIDGRLELLDSQRQLSAARQSLLDLRREEISNAIALYKSLGGGSVGP